MGGDRGEEAEVGTGVEAGGGAGENWDIVVEVAAGDVVVVGGGDSRRSGQEAMECCRILDDGEWDEGCSAAGGMLAWEGPVACNRTSATTWWRRVRQAVS